MPRKDSVELVSDHHRDLGVVVTTAVRLPRISLPSRSRSIALPGESLDLWRSFPQDYETRTVSPR